MNAPLKTMVVTSPFGVKRTSSGLPDKNGTLRHIGVDLRASVGTKVYAPDKGVVTFVDNVGLKYVEIRIGLKLHRFLHLSKNILKVGQTVKKGQLIGYSGNTGGVAAHLHWDVRKGGTAWNASFYNYQDPMKLLKENDMYKGHTAKYWYLQYVKKRRLVARVQGWLGTWRERYLKLKG